METAPPFRWAFLGPRYWPTWIGIALLWLLCLLPVPWLLWMGRGLGRGLGRALKSRRHVVRVNLRLCFPDLHEAALEQRVDEHFQALGTGLFESGLAWFASDARLRRHGEVRGLEHWNAVQARGQGALLLTGHFTTLELGARYLCLAGVKFHAMYRPINNGLIDFYMHRWRQARSGLYALPKDDLKKLVRALREGRAIWYGPDQALDTRHTVVVPFFGVPVVTVAATSRLAQMGRAAVLPYFPRHDGDRYVVEIQAPLADFPSGDDVADTLRVNQTIEQGVRLAPAEYFWVHRRFKRWKASMPDVYAK